MKKTLLLSLVLLLAAAVLLQWGLDRTPAGGITEEAGVFPAASSLLDFLGGARQYLAFTFYIKTDKLHHTYYGSFTEEAELIPYLKLATMLNLEYVNAYYVGAGIMSSLGRREEAIEYTRQGIGANPESADLYYSLGALYLEEKRYEEARRAFEAALAHEPELVSRNVLLTALAATCHALGDAEANLRALMDKAIYNQIRLYSPEYTYEEGKTILRIINNTLDAAAAAGREGG